MDFVANELLKPHVWWKIGGPADHFCQPRDAAEVARALRRAREEGWAVTVLGGGTNVLVSDDGVAGLVIHTRLLRGLEVREADGRLHLTALAGTPKSDLTKEFLRRRLAPALFLCGLPGDVGGGVVMNAGVAEAIVPREFGELVDWIEVLGPDDAEPRRVPRDQLEWAYRHSRGWQPGVVVRAGLSWPLAPDPDLPARVKLATRNRVLRQPLELPSCGSTFKNPPGFSAGALIEAAGLKGFRRGDAQVSPKHANFIVNLGQARARDVREIIAEIRARVRARSGVELETEVKFIGR